MNYVKHYNLLIERAQTRILENNIYVERHHIKPRCIGGSDDSSNIVILTAEEHYVAHQLLVKIYPEHQSLIFAANYMKVGSKHTQRNNKGYGWLKRKHSNAIRNIRLGTKCSITTRQKISKALIGKIRTITHSLNIGKAKKGVKMTTVAKTNISKAMKGQNNPFYGKRHTNETKTKISDARKQQIMKPCTDETRQKLSIWQKGKPKPKIICPYCGKEGGNSNMKRYHFDNCKFKDKTNENTSHKFN